MKKAHLKYILITPVLWAAFAGASFAAPEPLSLPNLSLSVGGAAGSPQGMATVVQIVLLLTVLTMAPAILLLMTSFTRLVIVFSILRQALGVQQAPPNQVIIGLSLFLTFFIMSPAFNTINQNALQPYMNGAITQQSAFDNALEPLRGFMTKNTREKDLEMFLRLSKSEAPKTKEEIPTLALIPAFVTSELKSAFQIGFLIYLPFLVIDMVVASVLMSMGMMMLPPVMISLPFKLMLFVLVDGWYLLVGSLVQSFG
ncbi:MAG: flagellar type III secretion system pore protein FliP [Deltaproteobacteria bacterium]|nr:flagellar type III secretion system pore protein FliP [Deltaproteobacteria bacterium]